MKQKTKDFIQVAVLLVAVIGLFWTIWTSGIVLDSSLQSKLSITNLILLSLLAIYILYTSKK